MNAVFEFAVRSLLIGAGATLCMDLWAALLRRFGISSLNLSLLGRWIGHLPQGRWIHVNISKATLVRHEAVLGWCVHYGIGIGFASLLLATSGLSWARSPTLYPPLALGIVTVVAPLFILQPALGAGIASSKTPRPVFNSVKSLVTHTVFGVGLFLAAHLTAAVLPVRP